MDTVELIILICIAWPVFGALFAIILSAISREQLMLDDLLVSMFLGPLLIIAGIAMKIFEDMENLDWKKTIIDFRKKDERDLDP